MKSVFYAWQSDLPNSTNRTFIERCLELAIAQLNEKLLPDDQLTLDKDTQGHPGMPDIARVIFDKIDSCAVFVPDLSITTRSDSQRSAPNPNVLIELGYAMRAIGDRRIIGVFNESTGSRSELPFDLRSRRWPLSYSLSEESTEQDRKIEREKVVRALAEGLHAASSRIDNKGMSIKKSVEVRQELFGQLDFPGRFNNGQVIAQVDASTPGAKSDGSLIWRNSEQATLELRPEPGMVIESYVKLRELAVRDGFVLSAFGPRKAQWFSRNASGFIAGDVVANPRQIMGLCVTQLERNTGGLYGVNQGVMERDDERRYILVDEAREQFEQTLLNYLEFYRARPELGSDFSLYATFQQIQGTYLKCSPKKGVKPFGPVVDNSVFHHINRISLDIDVRLAIRPLFEKLWDNVGIRYEDERGVDGAGSSGVVVS